MRLAKVGVLVGVSFFRIGSWLLVGWWLAGDGTRKVWVSLQLATTLLGSEMLHRRHQT